GFKPTKAISIAFLFAIWSGLKDGKGTLKYHIFKELVKTYYLPHTRLILLHLCLYMITKRLWIRFGLLLCSVILIRFFCLNSFWVEKWYSTGVYPGIAAFLRVIFGWLPFSAGDFLYGCIIIWIFWK